MMRCTDAIAEPVINEIGGPPGSYSSSSIKRHRRTRAEIDSICDELYDIVSKNRPVTVRQAFYQASCMGLIEKTEAEYNGTIGRLLTKMRRDGRIPHRWIADNTRWMRKPASYTGLADFVEHHQRAYRRDLWATSQEYVEVWCEKEALAGVLLEETSKYDVPLMVSRGFASESYIYEAADTITDRLSAKGTAVQATIYYFGDYDPSGLKIGESIESGLRRLCRSLLKDWCDDLLIFERVAVTAAQIREWNLPTRPTKKEGNTHAKHFEGDSVELDAIPPLQLRALVRGCIERHIDQVALRALRTAEQSEREQLLGWAQQLQAGQS
jgi:hypothetical protein